MANLNRIIPLLILAGLCACAAQSRESTAPAASDAMVHARSIDQAIHDGVAFLEADQNPDGSWGTGTVTHGNEVEVSIPGSLDGFRVAVTSLCVMALRETGEKTAHDKGLEWLLENYDVRRPDAQLIYNIWTHMYVVQCLAAESRTNPDPRIRQVVAFHLDRMARYETYLGGWNYYDFGAQTQQPSSEPTSFGTAAGLVALQEAQADGFKVDPHMVQVCIKRLEEMRMPNGACLYDRGLRYLPMLPGNMPQGSAGRAAAADCALLLWKSQKVDDEAGRAGLDMFFKQHFFLELGRKSPYPHESWYQVSGYYYYFDHYYAAMLMDQLGPAAKKQYAPQMLDAILPHQEADGSWWDFPMWDYHKPYGTAFAIMTLLDCK
jgi:hypothetical protein